MALLMPENCISVKPLYLSPELKKKIKQKLYKEVKMEIFINDKTKQNHSNKT